MLKLIIGNKAYSSWSLRGWLAVKQSGLPFEELVVPALRRGMGQAPRGRRIRAVFRARCRSCGTAIRWCGTALRSLTGSPTESAARKYWPEDDAARAMARSMAAEMHSGYSPRSVREHGMNIRKPLSRPRRFPPEVEAELTRLFELWAQARARFGGSGDFLFGELRRGRHDVRAGLHAAGDLFHPRAPLRPALSASRVRASVHGRTGSPMRRPRTG